MRSDTDYNGGFALFKNENRARYDALPAEQRAGQGAFNREMGKLWRNETREKKQEYNLRAKHGDAWKDHLPTVRLTLARPTKLVLIPLCCCPCAALQGKDSERRRVSQSRATGLQRLLPYALQEDAGQEVQGDGVGDGDSGTRGVGPH